MKNTSVMLIATLTTAKINSLFTFSVNFSVSTKAISNKISNVHCAHSLFAFESSKHCLLTFEGFFMFTITSDYVTMSGASIAITSHPIAIASHHIAKAYYRIAMTSHSATMSGASITNASHRIAKASHRQSEASH